MIDPDLERTLRMLKLHDEPRLRAKVLAAHGTIANAWLELGKHLEHGLGTRVDRVSAREAYKAAMKGDPGLGATAAFRLAMLLEAHPELCEEYGDGRERFGTSPEQYWREGAKLAVAAADARFRFWKPNQRTPELAGAIAPLIARRKHDAAFGDPDAMYELSQLLKEGFGVPRHHALSATWLHRAAAAGHLGAACRLKPERWDQVAREAVRGGMPGDNAPTLASHAPQGAGDAPVLGGGPASPFQLLRATLPPTLPSRWPMAVGRPEDGDEAKADAGDLEAQLRLGAATGPEGAYWLTLAAAAGHPSAFPLRDALALAPEAEQRAEVWWERHRA